MESGDRDKESLDVYNIHGSVEDFVLRSNVGLIVADKGIEETRWGNGDILGGGDTLGDKETYLEKSQEAGDGCVDENVKDKGVDGCGGVGQDVDDCDNEYRKEEVIFTQSTRPSQTVEDKDSSLALASLVHTQADNSPINRVDIATRFGDDTAGEGDDTTTNLFDGVAPSKDGDNATGVTSDDIQSRPQDYQELFDKSGHPNGSQNDRDVMGEFLDTKDADNTVCDDGLAHVDTNNVSFCVEHDLATAEDILSSHQLDGQTLEPRSSQFPALDNVDLETDEEADKEAGTKEFCDVLDGDGANRFEEKVCLVPDRAGKRIIITSLSTGEDQESAMTNNPVSDNAGGDAASNSQKTRSDLHLEYPLNYHNYKVCKELRPGVKQCLILETGEQFICVSQNKSTSVGVPSEDPDMDRRSSHTISKSGHSYNTQIIDDESTLPTPEVNNLYGNEEASSYISFSNTGRGIPGASDVGSQDNKDNQTDSQDNGVSLLVGETKEVGKLQMLEHRAVHDRGSTNPSSEDDDGDIKKIEVVEDVLIDDGAETSRQFSSNKKPSTKKYRKIKHERFIELQPEIVTAITEESARSSDSDANKNNNSNERVSDSTPGDVNVNANSRSHRERQELRDDVLNRATLCGSDRLSYSERGDQDLSVTYMSPSRGVSSLGSRAYPQSTSRDSTYLDSKGHRSGSGDGSSFYSRSREPSLLETSQMSTRYSRIDRGDSRNMALRTESVTIPHFKTLHDQQVNWQDMFRVIEQQHRSELKSQYQEHKKILQDMQKNMEKELMKQQDTLKQRLITHREILEELSPGRSTSKNINQSWTQGVSPGRSTGKNINQSWTQNGADSLSLDSVRSSNAASNNTSHITLQGVPVALRNPPPLSRYHHEHRTYDELPVQRCLDKEFSSPAQSTDMSLNLRSNVSIDRDKQLRGGVYSSPLPLAKVKHKSPRGSKSYEETQHGSPQEDMGHKTSSLHRVHSTDTQAGSVQYQASPDVSLTESDEVLSPRTRISLKEKHAKHLSDLRAYYEKELRTLREVKSHATAEDKILAHENQELRQKYQELQEVYHDANIKIRELQQKIQGLEIRAADYSERYSATQSQVLTLKSRLEELADYAREKEAAAADLSNKDKKYTESLQMAYAKEKELTESLRSAKSTIEKLVDKYEILEKEHIILKETSAEAQEKLFCSRAELVDINHKLSRLEMENKQLKHTNENLRRNLATSQGAIPIHTNYEDSYHNKASPGRSPSTYRSINTSTSRSPDRSYNGHSRDRGLARSGSSSGTESDNDFKQSPIIKAERELKKLQQSEVFTPKLQRKFYGTERPASYSGPPVIIDSSSSQSTHSSKNLSSHDRRPQQMAPQGRESNSRSSTSMSSHLSRSQHEVSRPNADEKTSSYIGYKDNNLNRNHNISPKKSSNITNGISSEQAVELVKSREIVSRPAWEDIFTSLTTSRPVTGVSKGSPTNYTREQIFRERMQNIENLERKYDDLTNEKRKHEAALSKLPGQGQGRERDRLESELDRLDKELGSVRMSLKRYHVLKSTI